MIYVTHDQTEALTFADTVVVMHDGAVVQTGTPEELFERPAHTFVGHFIGSPGMNVLPAKVEGRTAHVGGVAIALERAYPTLPAAERIELGVRPEFATLAKPGHGLPVKVTRIEDIGRARIARIEISGNPAAAMVPEELSLDGDSAGLTLDPRQIHIYANGVLVPGAPAGREEAL